MLCILIVIITRDFDRRVVILKVNSKNIEGEQDIIVA